MLIGSMRVARRLRSLTRVTRRVCDAGLALLVAGAVFLSASQAGRTYVYCRVMQTVMSHACCAARGGAHQASAHAELASECCQPRSVASLAECTPAHRSDDHPALSAALAPLSNVEPAVAPARATALSARDPKMRAGPPKLRLHALVMVFHV